MAIRSRNNTGSLGYAVGNTVSKDLAYNSAGYYWVDWGGDVFDSLGFFRLRNLDTGVEFGIPMPNGNGGDGVLNTESFTAFGVQFEVTYGYAAQGIYRISVKQAGGNPVRYIFKFHGNFGSDGDEHYVETSFDLSASTKLYCLHHYGGGDQPVRFYFIAGDQAKTVSKYCTWSNSRDNIYYETYELNSDGFHFYVAKSNDVHEWVMADLITSNADILNMAATTLIHKGYVNVTARLTHRDPSGRVRYRIFVNGTQRYPASGWSDFSTAPHDVFHSFQYTMFVMGNNTVRLEVSDETGDGYYRDFTVVQQSTAPRLVVVPSSLSVHSGTLRLDGNIDDPEGDKVSYRVFLNSVQIFPSSGFTALEETPLAFTRFITNEALKIGANTLKVDVHDEFGVTTSWSGTVIKTNGTPTLQSPKLRGLTVSGTVRDPENDKVRYRILVNNIQLFPVSGWTEYLNTPFDINYTFTSDRIKIGAANRVRVELEDEFGGIGSWEYSFTGAYSGLLFTDAAGSFYSTDSGELLKYLDIGTLVAGQVSAPVRVYVKNTLGYSVKNIRLWVDNRELDPASSWVEISKLNAPFSPEGLLIYSEELADQGTISFYVRIYTNRQAIHGGMFDIHVKGDPV